MHSELTEQVRIDGDKDGLPVGEEEIRQLGRLIRVVSFLAAWMTRETHRPAFPAIVDATLVFPAVSAYVGEDPRGKVKHDEPVNEREQHRLGQRVRHKVHQGLQVGEDVRQQRGAKTRCERLKPSCKRRTY